MKQFGKFKDAGREEKNTFEVEKSSKKRRTKTFGKITIDRNNFPYLKDKEIGDVCDLLIRAQKTSESMADEWETDKDEKIQIEILKIAEPKIDDEYEEIIHNEEHKMKKY
jgi:hypothetical protein